MPKRYIRRRRWTSPASAPPGYPGDVYYVDATNGVDSNNGTSTATAWRSMAKVNAATIPAGANVLFKRGEVWRDNVLLNRNGTGTSSGRVTFGAYGAGARPVISGGRDLSSSGAWTQPNVGSYPNVWQAAVGTYDIGQLILNSNDTPSVGTRRNVGGSLDSESSGTTLYLSANSSKYLSATADYYNGAHLYVRAGTHAGVHRVITDYVRNTAPTPDDYVATVDATGTWSTTDYYMIHGYASPFLSAEGHFSHDEQSSKLYLYTAYGNPGTHYNGIIACQGVVGGVLNKDTTGYATVQDIDFMHCADKDATLIVGSNTIVERCAFKWCGGEWANNFWARDGYGISMYNVCDNVHIRYCTFYEVYDCGVTCQPGSTTNLYIHHNIFHNADGALELYPGSGTYGDIYYVNNTAYGIGDGLVGSQGRLDIQGPCHQFWLHTDDVYGGNIVIKNNIGVMGTGDSVGRIWNFNAATADPLRAFTLDYNCWRPDQTNAYKYNSATFYSTLAGWKGATRSPDPHSINSDPQFVDAAAGDFTPQAAGCLGTGQYIAGINVTNPPNLGAVE